MCVCVCVEKGIFTITWHYKITHRRETAYSAAPAPPKPVASGVGIGLV